MIKNQIFSDIDLMHVCLPDRRVTGGRAPPRAEAVVKLKNRTGVL